MEAACYHQEKDRFICDICPVHCSLSEGQVSVCQGRQVVDGKLQAINYGQVVALHLDPIEKKPLYHVMPGSEILSVGANGCNLHCQWCQNCEISQGTVVTRFMAPEEIAQAGVRSPSVGIAYTYTEPFIWYETLRDTIPLVHALGGINVLVTNGFVEKEPLEALLPYIDAANVDLKFLDDELYKKYTGGRLPTVQHTIARMVESGVHVEITHLMVSGLVEPLEHIRKLKCMDCECKPQNSTSSQPLFSKIQVGSTANVVGNDDRSGNNRKRNTGLCVPWQPRSTFFIRTLSVRHATARSCNDLAIP